MNPGTATIGGVRSAVSIDACAAICDSSASPCNAAIFLNGNCWLKSVDINTVVSAPGPFTSFIRCPVGCDSPPPPQTCSGGIALGESCDDYNECTTDDTCMLTRVQFVGGEVRAVCRGTPAVNMPCEDNNFCTDNDRCMPYDYDPSYYVQNYICLGFVRDYESCDDGNPCTIDDRCRTFVSEFAFSLFAKESRWMVTPAMMATSAPPMTTVYSRQIS